MQVTSFRTVTFTLDQNERETMNDALEIMRKVKNKFLTSEMPKHQEQLETLIKLVHDVIDAKEISE